MNRDSIKRWFRQEQELCLGLTVGRDIATMVMLEKYEEEGIRIVWQDCLRRLNNEAEEDFFERIGLKILQNVPKETVGYLSLDGQDVFFYEKTFPDIPAKELHSGIRLDFAAASGWRKKYYLGYESMGDDLWRVAGIQTVKLREKLKFWQSYFDVGGGVLFCNGDEEMFPDVGILDGECPYGEDVDRKYWQRAIHAALIGAGEKGIFFSLGWQGFRNWNLLHCSCALWVLSLLMMLCFGICLEYNLFQEKEEMAYFQERLALLSDVAERKSFIDADMEVIQRKNLLMGKLRNGDVAGQGILINVSRAIPDGMWLTSISAESSNKIILAGKAKEYGSISSFIENLTHIDDFGKGEMILRSSDIDKSGMIEFLVEGVL